MYTLNCKGRMVTLQHPVVMGILNVTPDSFHVSSRVENETALLELAGQMLRDGAVFLDIGGMSTRPGATAVSEEEELRRVIPAVAAVHAKFPDALVSVDTVRTSVARAAIAAGASLINDVSGPNADPEMFLLAAAEKVPYVAMHSRGTPETMQSLTDYSDLSGEVTAWLAGRIAACRTAGVMDVIADPGFGFAKTIDQNFELLRKLKDLQILGAPLLVGVSRKSMVYKTLRVEAAAAGNGTTVLHTIALLNGASILRTHDVLPTVEAIRLVARMAGQREAF